MSDLPDYTSEYALRPQPASEMVSQIVNCPLNTLVTVCTLTGRGELVEVYLEFAIATPPTRSFDYLLYIYIDGVKVVVKGNAEITQSLTATFGRCAFGEMYQYSVEGVERTYMYVRLPLQFKSSITLKAKQVVGNTSVQGSIVANTFS